VQVSDQKNRTVEEVVRVKRSHPTVAAGLPPTPLFMLENRFRSLRKTGAANTSVTFGGGDCVGKANMVGSEDRT